MGLHAASHRTYWVYTPATYHVGTAVPLIMILHGCMQPYFSHPWAIAYDTHMNQLAETHQFLVVYPHHFAPPDVNPASCWDFFLPVNQHRDGGELASLAGIVKDMLKNTSRWTIDQKRIYVAGISSGGGATANLGATYPDLFAAIAVHSGAEYGYPLPFLGQQAQARDAAEPSSEAEALSGEVEKIAVIPPGPDPVKQGENAFQAMGSFARVVPTIVFHGTADHVSDPINGDQVTQQWITTNHLASPRDFTATFEHPSSTIMHPAGSHGERPYTVYTWQDVHGRDVVSYYKVDGMGHAWSGGTPGSIFTDPSGPDASKAIYEFFMAHPKERKEIQYPQPAGEQMLPARKPSVAHARSVLIGAAG
ncbi:MAG TPA: PHB depolymerase family esterase [Nakamurella sp.]